MFCVVLKQFQHDILFHAHPFSMNPFYFIFPSDCLFNLFAFVLQYSQAAFQALMHESFCTIHVTTYCPSSKND